MADVVRISVDGQDGAIVSRSYGIRLVSPNNDLALVRQGESRDGLPGLNASRATPGAPAGFLAVDLSESVSVQEGITVRTLGFTSRQEPPQYLEVPARRDLMLSAVGGRGEAGHIGGNGQAGMNGVDGAPATREVDATPGTDGGNGGDAGQGSNGADGGDGGTIEISVDEDNTHLLFAVQYDVKGGEGGSPGRHGQPGRGGEGGNGGAGHEWRELVGYKYHCTPNCIGHTQSSMSTSLVRAGSVVGTSTLALMAPIRAHAVQGGNLQALIASAAQRYGASRHQRIDPGSCRCGGGTGNCHGCESVPIHSNLHRIPGANGRDGRPGRSMDNPLFAGSVGQSGNATFYVRNHDGSEQRFAAPFQLELLDFDVEDENGDGVFEPGEHVFICRIRVRNTGGMPSPKRGIPVSAVASKWFLPTTGDGEHAFIPSSIMPGITATLEGSIKVLISQSDEPRSSENQLLARERLSVQATMPWLNRHLPCFEYSPEIDIQYPVELRSFRVLPSMAQGSMNQFTFESLIHKVFNRSSKALGSMSNSWRHVETRITFPDDCGALLSQPTAWGSEVIREVTELAAQGSSQVSQKIRIAPQAESYCQAAIQVDLYISVPMREPTVHGDTEIQMQLIQQNDLVIQISAHHQFNGGSDFLLVTNSNTSRDRVRDIQRFVMDELDMQIDEWNVSLYGGLQYRPESSEAPPDYVMERYRGKTILFIGNLFEFFESGNRNTCQMCDPQVLAELCVHGTGFLFLELSDPRAFTNLVRALVTPAPHQITNSFEHQMASRSFNSRSDLVESLKQHKRVGGSPEIALYTLPVERQWYRPANKVWPKGEAKGLTGYLRQQLPNERFLVTAIKRETTTESKEYHIILHGVPHSIDLMASEVRPRGAGLDSFEAFMIADSLPSQVRVNILWSLPANSAPHSELAFTAIKLSLLLKINTEIRTFLHKASWPNAIRIPNNSQKQERQTSASFLTIHLPTLAQLLQHPTAQAIDTAPEHILELFKYTLASCRPQKKRHLLHAILVPFAHRRSQLHTALVPIIGSIVSHKVAGNQAFLADFNTQTNVLYSKRNKGGRRDTRNVILQTVSELTKCSTHVFLQGRFSARKIVPRTECCTPDEWNRRWDAGERERELRLGETRDAWEVLGRLVIEA